jgi:FlaA1/EpsC-like NDP-sugar epimerase
MANVDGRVIRSIVRTLEPFKVEIKTLPDVKSLLDGAITVRQVRPLVLEDLLARTPIQLDPQPVRNLVYGKRILVTGAGGSIGSELCRQIAPLGPTELLLYERHENGLYSIEKDLRDTHSECPLVPLLGDVTDAQRFESILSSYKPDLIFHAAAHKHVPLMELNPCEALKNNVVGTRVAIEAAHRHAVGQFILVSTDSVMGATKRVAEFMAQSMAGSSPTRFSVVRFGNVLGSNGSVVPRFVEQIKKGGPITVTHPEMRRFLMLIPEAVELLLHAAAMNERGALYILNMGEQVKILDVARDLIRLSGLIPDEEIAIEFTGLRPGEKLSEELVEADEALEHSGVNKIFRVKTKTTPEKCWLWNKITELERRALDNDSAAVIELLCQIVVNFRPDFSAHPVTGHFPGIKDSAEAAGGLRRILQPATAILRN